MNMSSSTSRDAHHLHMPLLSTYKGYNWSTLLNDPLYRDIYPSLNDDSGEPSSSKKLKLKKSRPPNNQVDTPFSQNGNVMTLPKKDSYLYGVYPEVEKFILCVCYTCNTIVKPQCLKRHMQTKHGVTQAAMDKKAAISNLIAKVNTTSFVAKSSSESKKSSSSHASSSKSSSSSHSSKRSEEKRPSKSKTVPPPPPVTVETAKIVEKHSAKEKVKKENNEIPPKLKVSQEKVRKVFVKTEAIKIEIPQKATAAAAVGVAVKVTPKSSTTTTQAAASEFMVPTFKPIETECITIEDAPISPLSQILNDISEVTSSQDIVLDPTLTNSAESYSAVQSLIQTFVEVASHQLVGTPNFESQGSYDFDGNYAVVPVGRHEELHEQQQQHNNIYEVYLKNNTDNYQKQYTLHVDILKIQNDFECMERQATTLLYENSRNMKYEKLQFLSGMNDLVFCLIENEKSVFDNFFTECLITFPLLNIPTDKCLQEMFPCPRAADIDKSQKDVVHEFQNSNSFFTGGILSSSFIDFEYMDMIIPKPYKYTEDKTLSLHVDIASNVKNYVHFGNTILEEMMLKGRNGSTMQSLTEIETMVFEKCNENLNLRSWDADLLDKIENACLDEFVRKIAAESNYDNTRASLILNSISIFRITKLWNVLFKNYLQHLEQFQFYSMNRNNYDNKISDANAIMNLIKQRLVDIQLYLRDLNIRMEYIVYIQIELIKIFKNYLIIQDTDHISFQNVLKTVAFKLSTYMEPNFMDTEDIKPFIFNSKIDMNDVKPKVVAGMEFESSSRTIPKDREYCRQYVYMVDTTWLNVYKSWKLQYPECNASFRNLLNNVKSECLDYGSKTNNYNNFVCRKRKKYGDIRSQPYPTEKNVLTHFERNMDAVLFVNRYFNDSLLNSIMRFEKIDPCILLEKVLPKQYECVKQGETNHLTLYSHTSDGEFYTSRETQRSTCESTSNFRLMENDIRSILKTAIPQNHRLNFDIFKDYINVLEKSLKRTIFSDCDLNPKLHNLLSNISRTYYKDPKFSNMSRNISSGCFYGSLEQRIDDWSYKPLAESIAELLATKSPTSEKFLSRIRSRDICATISTTRHSRIREKQIKRKTSSRNTYKNFKCTGNKTWSQQMPQQLKTNTFNIVKFGKSYTNFRSAFIQTRRFNPSENTFVNNVSTTQTFLNDNAKKKNCKFQSNFINNLKLKYSSEIQNNKYILSTNNFTNFSKTKKKFV